ncbi:MAG TPA: fused MFS/spermidine synthase [Candidatus Eisenbacteria bacterium]|nr:fused MFS/spermidine synthase [Candidatus Eisenbacteria bacterium]
MTTTARSTDPSRVLVPACFFFSGAAGLALEVVWSKYLSLLLGNSVHGVATVVAAFLGGLGIGAALAGRRASGVRNPLAGYATLEAVVGLLALVSPFAYQLGRPLFAGLYESLGGTGPLFHGVRFVLLFATLLIPTIAMGATLPLIVEDASRRRPREASASVARLYAINTGGAVAGTVLAGFLAVPEFGLAKTAIAAGLIDLAIAAILVSARIPAPAPAREKRDGGAPTGPGPGTAPALAKAAPFAAWLLPAFALSGLAAILYQVAWTRLLTVPFGGITYAFSAILAIYLLGLALGAAGAQRALKRARAPVVLFGILQAALAGSVAGGLHALQRLPHWQTAAIAASDGSVTKLLTAEAIITAVLLLPPTLLLGALFPVAVAVRRAAGAEASRATGAVYSANTVGSIAGSLLTAYILIPKFGAPVAILGAASLNALLGVAALLGGEPAARARRLGAGVVVAAAAAYALFGMPSWSEERMSIGLIRLLRSYWYGGEALTHKVIDAVGQRADLGKILFYREGPVASVAVIETQGQRTLLINGKADATTGAGSDMRTQVLVGHLPLLVTPKASDVFVIGYGSGVTTAATLTHDVREVRTVELEPAVVEAAPQFRESAGDPLHDPRHRMLVEDASLVLRSERREYDVIVSEPSNFWIAGMGNLFSDDFYNVAATRLRPGGVLCQWVQCYQISPEAIRAVIRTLARTFPHGQIFYVDTAADLIILASPREDVPLDLAAWTEAFRRPTVAADLARVGVEKPADLLRYYRGRLDRVAAEAGAGPVNTDDNGWLEHRAPFDLLKSQSAEQILGWDDKAVADLARSLGEGGPAAAAAAIPLLEEAAARAEAAGDAAAAEGLRRTRAALTPPAAGSR